MIMSHTLSRAGAIILHWSYRCLLDWRASVAKPARTTSINYYLDLKHVQIPWTVIPVEKANLSWVSQNIIAIAYTGIMVWCSILQSRRFYLFCFVCSNSTLAEVLHKERSLSGVFYIYRLWRQISRIVFSTVHLSKLSRLGGFTFGHSKVFLVIRPVNLTIKLPPHFTVSPVLQLALVLWSCVMLVNFGNRNSQDTAWSVNALALVFFSNRL
jgi:hypothetical protein